MILENMFEEVHNGGWIKKQYCAVGACSARYQGSQFSG